MKKSNIRFVCLNEAICPVIPQRLADQKAKMIEMFIEEFNDDIYTSTRLERKWDNLKKEFEELKL